MTSLKFRASKERTLAFKGPLKTALLTQATSPPLLSTLGAPHPGTRASEWRCAGSRQGWGQVSAGRLPAASRGDHIR